MNDLPENIVAAIDALTWAIRSGGSYGSERDALITAIREALAARRAPDGSGVREGLGDLIDAYAVEVGFMNNECNSTRDEILKNVLEGDAEVAARNAVLAHVDQVRADSYREGWSDAVKDMHERAAPGGKGR